MKREAFEGAGERLVENLRSYAHPSAHGTILSSAGSRQLSLQQATT